MAERRMFAKTIIGSARFLRMPPSSRLLYYDLGMEADDDGCVEAFAVMRKTCATEDDLRVLVSKGFVQVLNDDLVSFITNWSENNHIRKDRYHEGRYKTLLDSKCPVLLQDGCQVTDSCQPAGNQTAPEYRLGKVRLGEDSIGEIASPAKPTKHKHGQYNNVLLTDEEYSKLQSELPGTCELYIERLSEYMESSGKHYKSHLATIRNWARKDKEKGVQKEAERNPFMKYANEYAGNSEDTSGFEAELPAGF